MEHSGNLRKCSAQSIRARGGVPRCTFARQPIARLPVAGDRHLGAQREGWGWVGRSSSCSLMFCSWCGAVQIIHCYVSVVCPRRVSGDGTGAGCGRGMGGTWARHIGAGSIGTWAGCRRYAGGTSAGHGQDVGGMSVGRVRDADETRAGP